VANLKVADIDRERMLLRVEQGKGRKHRNAMLLPRRLIRADDTGVTFRVKNYRVDGDSRYTTMTLDAHEFIRRVLLHVLPKGFHRIRHTGFLASGGKADNIVKARELLAVAPPETPPIEAMEQATTAAPTRTCPCCGSAMHVIETFERGATPSHPAAPSRLVLIRIDTPQGCFAPSSTR
jgi:hypothetical protein